MTLSRADVFAAQARAAKVVLPSSSGVIDKVTLFTVATKDVPALCADWLAMEAEIERLQRALVGYGQHTPRCLLLADALDAMTTADGRRCTCGLDRALAAPESGRGP